MKFIFSFLLSIIFFCGNAQPVFITGKVVDAETESPLQGASVFAENTTLGTATDAEGNFRLWLPQGGYELIVTYTGYNSANRRITTTDSEDRNQLFRLKVREKELADVAVVATSEVKDGWEKYGDFFIAEFIGSTENSNHCTIKNREVLRFFYSKKRDRLKVIANEPVLIENKSLGYNIRYNLDSFTHEYKTKVSMYTGSPLFEEMKTSDLVELQRWVSARQKAYEGSILHFMRSVYQQQLSENGFEIQFIVNVNDKDKAIQLKNPYGALNYKKDDSTQVVEIKPNQLNLGVIYKKEKPSEAFLASHENEPSAFQFSMLTFLPGNELYIEQNGYYFEQNDITINAYWTWEKVADLLPYDYTPPDPG